MLPIIAAAGWRGHGGVPLALSQAVPSAPDAPSDRGLSPRLRSLVAAALSGDFEISWRATRILLRYCRWLGRRSAEWEGGDQHGARLGTSFARVALETGTDRDAGIALLSECLAAYLAGARAGRRERQRMPQSWQAAMSQETLRVVEEERRRLARELHDETGQVLTSCLFRVDLCLAKLPDDRERILAELREVRQSIFDCSRQLHRLAFNLRPPILEDLGLATTLQWYLRQWSQQHGIAVELIGGISDADGKPGATDVETAVFRIVQESLTNVAKYAGATKVKVRLERDGRELRLAIFDNGVGFDVERAESSRADRPCLGLLGMRERARLLGGRLTIESACGQGTAIRVVFPLGASCQYGGINA